MFFKPASTDVHLRELKNRFSSFDMHATITCELIGRTHEDLLDFLVDAIGLSPYSMTISITAWDRRAEMAFGHCEEPRSAVLDQLQQFIDPFLQTESEVEVKLHPFEDTWLRFDDAYHSEASTDDY